MNDLEYPAGKSAAVSFTFDDGNQSQVDLALPILDEFGFKATFFVIAGPTRERKNDPLVPDRSRAWWAEVSWEEWRAIAARGHEIGNHSLTHPVLIKLPDPRREIVESARLITEKMGKAPASFCFPFNKSNAVVQQLALQHHEFATEKRARYGGPLFSLPRVNRRVDRAIRRHDWLVAMLHGIGNGFDPVEPDVLRRHLEYIKQREDSLWIDTFATVSRWVKSGHASPLSV